MHFHAEADELLVWDVDGQLRWRGKPEQRPVQWAAAIPNSSDGLALYHYYRPDHPYGAFETLVRVRPDGSIVWRAELPETSDVYVTAGLTNGRLFARSYGCYDVEINIETGKIVTKQFTK